GARVTTVAERRRALAGFVLSRINMDHMLHVVSTENESVAFQIYDNERPDAGAVYYSSATWRRLYGYQSAETVRVGGQPWQIIVRLAPQADVALQAGQATLGTG